MGRYMRSAFFIFLLAIAPQTSLALTPQQWHAETETVIPAEWQTALDTRIAQIVNQPSFVGRLSDLATFVDNALSTTGLSLDEHRGLVHQARAAVLTQLKEEKARLENDQKIEDRSMKRDLLVQLMQALNKLDLSSAQSIARGKKVLHDALTSYSNIRSNSVLKDFLPACTSVAMNGFRSPAPEKAVTAGAIILSCVAVVAMVVMWKAAEGGAKVLPNGAVILSEERYGALSKQRIFVDQICKLLPLFKNNKGEPLGIYIAKTEATQLIEGILIENGHTLVAAPNNPDFLKVVPILTAP